MSTEIDSVSASTVSATATAGGCHLLKVAGYSESVLLGNGVALPSCEFEAGGYRWRISYYPRSKISADKVVFALELTTKGVSRPVYTKLRFTLIPHHGKPAPATTYCRNDWQSFDYTGDLWGFPIIKREELESSEYLVDDCFSVRCDVHVINILAVEDEVVQAHDLVRMGLACSCTDDLCKRRHASGWGLERAPVSGSTTPIRRSIKAAWLRLFRRKH